MRAAVTGGCGFIGSHLVDLLISEGHQVVVLDNLSTGRIQNLSNHQNSPKLKIHIVDIAQYSELEHLLQDVDWVFHLAALADIVPSIEEPYKYHEANVNGTLSVLEASRNSGVKRFIYAASSSCYGIPVQYPTNEDAPIHSMYPYALTKYIGEQYVLHWCQTYQLPAISLRLFNVYGPRVRTTGTYGAVFGVFMAQKLSNQPMTIVGTGDQTRDFTFVTDVAQAFLQAAKSPETGQVMNVGSGNTYSIKYLTQLLSGPTVNIPERPGEPNCTYADTTKISNLLNWQPQVTFEDGVKIMVDNIGMWDGAPVWDPNTIAEATKSWFRFLS